MASRLALRTRIADIDQHIARLAIEISSLCEQKKDLEQELHAFVYPVLTIPPELTSEIFTQVVDSVGGTPYYPLTLASVCRRWREIALSSYRLWHRLDMDCNRTNSPALLLELWLSRAGGLPLDIYVLLDESATETSIFDTMVKFAPRWRNLDLRLDPSVPSAVLPFLQDLPPALPLLQSLTLKGSINYVGEEPSILFPALQKITLVGPLLPTGMQNIHGVTTLVLRLVPYHELLRVLRLTPAVEVLDLEISSSASDLVMQALMSPLILPALHTVTCRGDLSLSFLQDVALPGLLSLKLSAMFDHHQISAALNAQPAGATSPCRTRVQTLHMHNLTMNVRRLFSSLGLFPNARDVTLEFSGWLTWPRGTLVALAESAVMHEGVQILPALESFTLRGPSREANLSGLVDFVEYRSGATGIAKLRRLGIHFLGQMDLSSEMNELTSLGLDLELRDVTFEEFDAEEADTWPLRR
ncbi:hypothetical protein C8F01DRAFT_1232633 [Mycena amicta]|nr:hypothetical protein C8F01DRAFT_1232633 [Mycena amicta]